MQISQYFESCHVGYLDLWALSGRDLGSWESTGPVELGIYQQGCWGRRGVVGGGILVLEGSSSPFCAQVFSHYLIFELFDPCFLLLLCVPLLNTKRPLSNIWSLSYEQNSFGCFLKKIKFRIFSKTPTTVLLLTQQPNIAQRPFCI